MFGLIIIQLLGVSYAAVISTSTPQATSTSLSTMTSQATDTGTGYGSVFFDVNFQFDLSRTALIECGSDVGLPREVLIFAFPPSEQSVLANAAAFGSNQTVTKTTFDQHFDQLCSKRADFARCVENRLVFYGNQHDEVLSHFIDGRGIKSALDLYCDNKELVSSQFNCTVQAVKSTQCRGGIVDIMSFISHETNGSIVDFGYTCRNVIPNIDCRLQHQLPLCSASYADVMRDVTKHLLADECESGNVFAANDNRFTDIFPCFYDYYRGMGQRQKSYSDAVGTMIGEMEAFCGMSHGIMECMQQKTGGSQKLLDRFVLKPLGVNNLKNSVQHACSALPLLKTRIDCVSGQVFELASQNESCISNAAKAYSDDLRALGEPDEQKMKDLLCSTLRNFQTCLQPAFQSCDANLGNPFNNVFRSLRTNCKGDMNSAGGLIASLVVTTAMLLITTL